MPPDPASLSKVDLPYLSFNCFANIHTATVTANLQLYFYSQCTNIKGTAVVAQLTARWLPILEDPGSNPVIDNFDEQLFEQLFAVKFLKTKIKKQLPVNV